MVLRRIGVRSAIKLIFWLSVALGFVQVMIYVLAEIVRGVPASHFNLDFWIRIIIWLALFGANNAFMSGVLAYLYNFIAKRIGGLQFEFEPLDTPLEKRKNGDDTPDVV